MNLLDAIDLVKDEYVAACDKHDHEYVDFHHALGVLEEERYELVRALHENQSVEHKRQELAQIAAVCLRAIVELT